MLVTATGTPSFSIEVDILAADLQRGQVTTRRCDLRFHR